MPDVEVNGTRLEYAERGSGEPVVFVHGGFNDPRSWKGQMEAFGSRFRAVAPSCRHFHPNEPVPDGVRPFKALLRRGCRGSPRPMRAPSTCRPCS